MDACSNNWKVDTSYSRCGNILARWCWRRQNEDTNEMLPMRCYQWDVTNEMLATEKVSFEAIILHPIAILWSMYKQSIWYSAKLLLLEELTIANTMFLSQCPLICSLKRTESSGRISWVKKWGKSRFWHSAMAWWLDQKDWFSLWTDTRYRWLSHRIKFQWKSLPSQARMLVLK